METHSYDSAQNGSPAIRRGHTDELEMEMPGWFDQLTTHEEAAQLAPDKPAEIVASPRSPELHDGSNLRAKGTTGLLNKLGKLFGRHDVA